MVTGGGGGGSGAIDGGGGGGGADIFSIDRIDGGWMEVEFCLLYVVTSRAMMAPLLWLGRSNKVLCARVCGFAVVCRYYCK